METEQLTKIQRLYLTAAGTPGFDFVPTEEIAVALRIIDAQAATLVKVQHALDTTPYPLEAQRLASAIEAALAPAAPAELKNPFSCEPDCESPRCPVKQWEREHAKPAAAPVQTSPFQSVARARAAPVEEPPHSVVENALRRDLAEAQHWLACEKKACQFMQAERDAANARAEAAEQDLVAEQLSHQKTHNMLHNRLASVERNYEDARTALADIEFSHKTSDAERDQLKARVANMTTAHESLLLELEVAEGRIAELETELGDGQDDAPGLVSQVLYDAAEARLADATALLERWGRQHSAGTYNKPENWNVIVRDTRTFLSGQPAAPTRKGCDNATCYDAKCERPAHFNGPGTRWGDGTASFAQPATPRTVHASECSREGDDAATTCPECTPITAAPTPGDGSAARRPPA